MQGYGTRGPDGRALAQVRTEDAVLHVEVDGSGEPVTVLAHGLTNSCRELAAFTPSVPGTKVRFCFRGHGHSSVPEGGYRFADFARDLDAVARSYCATRAVGTSLGAGAITSLLAADPARFERIVFLLPAALDVPFEYADRYLKTAELFDGKTREEAIELLIGSPERAATYAQAPWLRDLDRFLMQDLNPGGVARAIREIVFDFPIADRQLLRAVEAPALLICREGDETHPARLGYALGELMPNAELLMFRDETEMVQAIPRLVERVARFLS